MVFTRRYSCGNTGLQPLLGSRGRKCGLIPPPPLSLVRSMSIDSSYAIGVPTTFGHRFCPPVIGREVVVAGGESARLEVTSYQSPAVIGEPPVTSAASPGNESDGVEVDALV